MHQTVALCNQMYQTVAICNRTHQTVVMSNRTHQTVHAQNLTATVRCRLRSVWKQRLSSSFIFRAAMLKSPCRAEREFGPRQCCPSKSEDEKCPSEKRSCVNVLENDSRERENVREVRSGPFAVCPGHPQRHRSWKVLLPAAAAKLQWPGSAK